MKAIIFGGSGFLGSHVADELRQRGCGVKIYDLEPSQYLENGQEMIVGDIIDSKKVAEAISGCDYVYNFAGIADLDDATTKARDTAKFNIEGNINIMDGAIKEKVKRYVYASSIYVYSLKGGFYRCSKQSTEIYIEEYNRRYGLNFSILCYGTLYGPRANKRNSIYRYLNHALKEKKLMVDGTGDELREYLHVRDAARLSVDILEEKFNNQRIVITGHHPTKFKDMLLMIREILGENVVVEFTGKENNDHYSFTPYSFVPKIGHKLVSEYYTDMGQGFLECLNEICKERQL